MTAAKTLLFGLVGFPVRHSLSPAMYNAAFKALGINAEYRLFEISPEDLQDFLLSPDKRVADTQGKYFRTGELSGFNITIPHKVRAKEILEQKYPLKPFGTNYKNDYIHLIGAINTVKREGERLEFWNTDCRGFLESLEKDLKFYSFPGTKALVIGCGGAGRAVIAVLAWHAGGCDAIYAYDANPQVMGMLRTHYEGISKDKVLPKVTFISQKDIPQYISRCQLLVNASPVGMDTDDAVISKVMLSKNKNLSVYDVVYNRETKLIKDAKALGLKAVGGLGMLLYQGALSFEHFTDKTAPLEIMREALFNSLKQ